MPAMLEKGTYTVAATKKYYPKTEQIRNRIDIGFPSIKGDESACYFVEVQDELHTNKRFRDPDGALSNLNQKLLQVD